MWQIPDSQRRSNISISSVREKMEVIKKEKLEENKIQRRNKERKDEDLGREKTIREKVLKQYSAERENKGGNSFLKRGLPPLCYESEVFDPPREEKEAGEGELRR